jgi:hypothetical protein
MICFMPSSFVENGEKETIVWETKSLAAQPCWAPPFADNFFDEDLRDL